MISIFAVIATSKTQQDCSFAVKNANPICCLTFRVAAPPFLLICRRNDFWQPPVLPKKRGMVWRQTNKSMGIYTTNNWENLLIYIIAQWVIRTLRNNGETFEALEQWGGAMKKSNACWTNSRDSMLVTLMDKSFLSTLIQKLPPESPINLHESTLWRFHGMAVHSASR